MKFEHLRSLAASRRRKPVRFEPGLRVTSATSVVSGAILLGACSCERTSAPSEPSAQPQVSAAPSAAPVAPNALPWSREKVEQAVNPAHEQPYSGPTGTVRGVVTMKGDSAPALTEVAEKIPDECKDARMVYGRLFREGMMRSLGDALVTVTGYKGFVPAKGDAIPVLAKDCAWSSRTFVLTYGQRLDVFSKDRMSYVPRLMGSEMKAEMVAVPGSGPVKLYPQVPGRYTLVDSMHLWMTAEVFVLKYPTATVTGMDGKFEITGVPVGEVTVSALMPSTMQVAQKKVKVEADKPVDVSLEIEFEQKKLARDAGAAPKTGGPKVEIH